MMIALSTKRTARAWFNMVEIILAMGVMFVAILSIMSLIPLGVKAGRDARMESYAADAAHGLLDYIAFQMLQQQSVNWVAIRDGIPTEPLPIDYDDLAPFGVGNEDPDPIHHIDEELSGTRYWELENLGTVDLRFLGEARLYSRNDARFGLTVVAQPVPPAAPPQPKKIYRLLLISTQTVSIDEYVVGPGRTVDELDREREVTELDAILRIWRSQVTGWVVDGTGWVPVLISLDDVVQLNIEVAWPAQASSHKNRHKAYYSMEVTNLQ